jgi:hypothetical protein
MRRQYLGQCTHNIRTCVALRAGGKDIRARETPHPRAEQCVWFPHGAPQALGVFLRPLAGREGVH